MQYGIITVPATWNVDKPVGFSKADHTQWHEQIKAGCRVLIFQTSPVNAIVAEGVIPDNVFQKLEEWPSANTHEVSTIEGNDAEYVMPLRIIRNYSETAQTSEDAVRKATQLDQISTRTWTPIDVNTFRLLTDIPE